MNPRETKICNHIKICTWKFIASLFGKTHLGITLMSFGGWGVKGVCPDECGNANKSPANYTKEKPPANVYSYMLCKMPLCDVLKTIITKNKWFKMDRFLVVRVWSWVEKGIWWWKVLGLLRWCSVFWLPLLQDLAVILDFVWSKFALGQTG